MIWLLKWQQTVWIILLASLVWSSGMISVPPDGGERLAGWWLMEEQSRSGEGLREWVERRVKVPLWLVQGYAWAVVGGWTGVSLGMGWQIWGTGGTVWSCGLLTLASHQVRTGLKRVAEVRRREAAGLAWQEMVESFNEPAEQPVSEPAVRGLVSLARRGIVKKTDKVKAAEKQPETCPEIEPKQSPAKVMGQTLAQLVAGQPIGTNRGLMLFLWMLVSGNLLESRGAIFPALQRMGLDEVESRRVWAAFAEGKWEISDLLQQWQQQVEAEGLWQEHRLGGYRVKAVDLVGFWRPNLKSCQTTPHYKAEAGKALPAIVLGVVTRVGQMGQQRVPLPTDFIRVELADPSEAGLVTRLLTEVADNLAQDELAVLDAGFALKELLAVGMERFLVRLATNATARRNYLPDYQGRGRPPEWGEKIRPLPRRYNGKLIEATPPDREKCWDIEHKGDQLTLKAQFWDNLVLADQKPGADSFNIVAIHDPRYQHPLLLATPLKLDGETFKALYADRWPVEQLPLSAKQMIGAARQFVHTDETVQRLPELSLLAGATLTYTAAKLPPIPTGFWDRAPKATPGRLRRVLTGCPFPANLPLSARIRKKDSVTDHLPKGILAHRRQKRSG
jgi:hypothetical protein